MLILYTTEDGKSATQLRAKDETVWLTQLEIAERFDGTKQNISLHLKNIFEDGELEASATVKESLTVQTEGSREVERSITLYNLEASLAIGYRVRSLSTDYDKSDKTTHLFFPTVQKTAA